MGQKKLAPTEQQDAPQDFLPPPPGRRDSRWGLQGKTVWDWLQLFIVPIVLVGIGLLFEMQQADRQRAMEEQQQVLEQRRAEAEQELAEQRAQDEALQAYFDQMNSLLLEKGLRDSDEGSEERTLARARTLTVLSRLDSVRKARLLQFLYEAGLLHKENRVISLNGADLSGIDLHRNNLSGSGPFLIPASGGFGGFVKPSNAANLSGAILSDANLEGAVLWDTDLSEADLSGADLSKAELWATDLSGAYLQEADLSGAELFGAELFDADLSDADLSGAYLTKQFSESREGTSDPYATNVDLSWAVLTNSNLSDANLSGANLSNANLSNANLSGADLSDARMSGVEGITKEELENRTSTLEGAIMPDGSFSSVEFEPALSVSLSEGGQIDEAPNRIYIDGPPVGKGGFIFAKPRHVFDPSNPSEQKEVPAPENVDEWVSWLQSHPNLETSKPVPAGVGGASGMRIDVAVISTLENYPQEACYGTPCVPLYPLSEGFQGWTSENVTIYSERLKYRFIIVDVGGETVVIQAAAPTDKFDEFLPIAQKVLDTVEWQE